MDAGIQQLLCHLFELIIITALLLEELVILAKIYLKFIQLGQEERLALCTLLLKNIPFDYFWGGEISMTDDHIPKIYRFGKNAYSIFGYSGRGIGPGTYFGKSIAEAFCK